jgi:hypothetical protein
MTNTNYVEELFKSIPEFKDYYYSIYDEKVDGFLPYIVFAKLIYFFIKEYRDQTDNVQKIQEFLDEMLKLNTKEATELVAFGFLESLELGGDDYDGIKKILIPSLRELLTEVDDFWMGKKTTNDPQ